MSWTPRKTMVAPPASSIRLDGDAVKQIAAKRTPRRGMADEERMSPEEQARRKEIQRRRQRLARQAESSGGQVPLDALEREDENEAVAHLPDHLYDLHALVDHQRGTDKALLEADAKLCQLETKRSAFVQAHYSTDGTRLTLKGPAATRGVIDAEYADLAASDEMSDTQRSHDHDETQRGGGRRSRRQSVADMHGSDVDWKTVEPYRTQLADIEGRYEFATSVLEDLFYAANDHFRRPGAGDYIFALDPRFVYDLTSDAVREMMDETKIDVVFTSDDELLDAIGTHGIATWRTAAEEVVELERKAQEAQRESDGADAPEASDAHSASSRRDAVDISEGPMTFVLSKATQSTAATLLRLQTKLQAAVDAAFAKERAALQEEAHSALAGDLGTSILAPGPAL